MVRAVRLEQPLRVDGRLDEDVYSTTPSVGGFIQQEPNEGEPSTERTEIWVFFDEDGVYIAARCWDSQPERMILGEMRRDTGGTSNENFSVVLDTFFDRRNGFMFHVNPRGGWLDATITDEGNYNPNWNTVWRQETERFDQGWMVEMAIPFKSLRYQPGASQVWGIHIRRIIRWKNEVTFITPVARALGGNGNSAMSYAATLVGIETPAAGKNLEIKPYATAGVSTDRTVEPPVIGRRDGDLGFDAKYGLSRGLIADLTVNTDFAQVEVDQQQINLTRFNLLLPEKREFFLEGAGVFAFGGLDANFGGGDTPILFFSRRIGITRWPGGSDQTGRPPHRAGQQVQRGGAGPSDRR